MDNPSRSERTRKAVIEAALAIIARDGPGRLTLDAIARESGISKGGLMHQFRTKESVLKALLEHQIAYFGDFVRNYLAKAGARQSQPQLAAQIAVSREAIASQNSVPLAVLGVVAQEPDLLSTAREIDAASLAAIKAEAADPETAMLRWVAARGLSLTALLGICPFSKGERDRLFDRLLDDRQWPESPSGPPARKRGARTRRTKAEAGGGSRGRRS